jgi:hypothetical protein
MQANDQLTPLDGRLGQVSRLSGPSFASTFVIATPRYEP